MEHLRELQWVRAVVDLERQVMRANARIKALGGRALGTYHEQASHVHDE